MIQALKGHAGCACADKYDMEMFSLYYDAGVFVISAAQESKDERKGGRRLWQELWSMNS